MTSEVIVMNKNGIALAADSAATLMPARRTYHNQNKIFLLSKSYPIGAMVHEKLRLNGVPWETIIKMYRIRHNDCGFDRVEDYLDHLIRFIATCEDLFDRKHPEVYWTCDSLCHLEALGQEIESAWHDCRKSDNGEQNISLMQFGNRHIEYQIEKLKALPDLGIVSDKKFKAQLQSALGHLEIDCAEQAFGLYPLQNGSKSLIKELLYLLTVKNDFSFGYSGIVLAGFGESDIFPVVATARLGGFYFGKLKYEIETPVRISDHNQAQIIPYASTDMVSTFIKGVHPHYEAYSLAETHHTMEKMMTDIVRHLNIPETADNRIIFNQLINDHFQQYKYNLLQHILNSHIQPVIDGIRFLPKDALASVAESLVNVTSFKTSVLPCENFVGGDIDVALVSKGDGFIWIKRKHYFDPEKNIDFFGRHLPSGRA